MDEASVRTKARTTASSYLPSKPDKYAIRLALDVDVAGLSAILMSCEEMLPRASNKKSKHVGDTLSLKT